jgi:predicted DsbA family dithiol-disulfide isomerase
VPTVEAGRKVGADFHYERQIRTSNTLAAHSLARLALADGGAALQGLVIDALFVAYFTNGEDVGDHVVLNRVAERTGMADDAVRRSIPLRDQIRHLDETARSSGLNAVPSYLVDGRLLFSGLQDVDGYVQRLTVESKSSRT